MGVLTGVYRAFCESHDATVDETALESRLGQLCARGRAAHPSFGVADAEFVKHLATSGAPVLDVSDEVHAEDLYLACACLAGNSAALSQLRAESRSTLARYLARIRGAQGLFEEVEQQLWNGALVGTGEGPKLASYSGRGPLASWIGISAQRIALMILRHERVEARAREEAAAQDRLVADDPELAAVKERFRAQFQTALEAGLGTLDDRAKRVFQLHLVDGLPLLRIAQVYSVHHETVRRWIASARGQVIEHAKRQLRESLPVSSGEFDSIARLLLSQLDLNISLILSERP